MRTLMTWAGRGMCSVLLVLSAAWTVLAFWYRLPFAETGRQLAAVFWVVLALWSMGRLWRAGAWRGLRPYVLALAGVLLWWVSLQASDTRDWAEDVSRHMQAQVQGDELYIRNVRNFAWRTPTEATPHWESRRYQLSQLSSVDMGLSYWMGPAIAHTLVSFGFEDERGQTDYLAFSVEIRKERHERFSAVAGFFKQFELALVAADERDLIRVRTNVRGEDVYLYRVQMSPEAMRSLLLAYVAQADELQRQPRFYDTLTANCTTIVYQMMRRIVDGLPLDWRLLASGYLPEYVHDVGALTPGYAVSALREAGRVSERAKAADADPQFSQAIRQGVLGMGQP